MNVLSLFDGMSCGQIALQRAGVPVECYIASEIDDDAIKVTMHNFTDTIQVGSVTDVSYRDGRLWVGDNSAEIQIDLLIGGSPCQGLSSLGKRRQFNDPRTILFYEYVRIYEEIKKENPDLKFLLENVMMEKDSMVEFWKHFGAPYKFNSALVSAQNRERCYWTNIPVTGPPENRKILLRDIIENGYVDREKSYALDANYYKGGRMKFYLNGKRQLVFLDEVIASGIHRNGVGNFFTIGNDSYFLDPKTGERICVDDRTRPLTVLECCRLQTVPENYFPHGLISNTAAYRCLGNGWTVDVVAHIFKNLL